MEDAGNGAIDPTLNETSSQAYVEWVFLEGGVGGESNKGHQDNFGETDGFFSRQSTFPPDFCLGMVGTAAVVGVNEEVGIRHDHRALRSASSWS